MRENKNTKRHNLYMLRCNHKLTQAEIAAKIGVSREGYRNVEHGRRDGTAKFWAALQKEFNIPDADMYTLMKLDEGEKGKCE